MSKTLLYARSATSAISDDELIEVQKTTPCQVNCCDSCEALIEKLSSLAKSGSLPDCIAIDCCFLKSADFTISETIGMISTFYRTISKSNRISIAIVLDASCSSQVLKDMQSNTDIIGMIPAPALCGKDTTIRAVREVLSHHRYWPSITITPVGPPPQEELLPDVHLTPRQAEILRLICNRGLSNKRIANLLKISESTVKIHVSAILKEYGVRNRTQLAIAATTKLTA